MTNSGCDGCFKLPNLARKGLPAPGPKRGLVAFFDWFQECPAHFNRCIMEGSQRYILRIATH
jgi:hypothetical protein